MMMMVEVVVMIMMVEVVVMVSMMVEVVVVVEVEVVVVVVVEMTPAMAMPYKQDYLLLPLSSPLHSQLGPPRCL